jgi:hypothetical protein
LAQLLGLDEGALSNLETGQLASSKQSIDASLRDPQDRTDLVDRQERLEARFPWSVSACHGVPR